MNTGQEDYDGHDAAGEEGMKARIRKREQLSQQFFADPTQWLDNRCTKKNSKQPDFTHKRTLEGLWMNGSRWLNWHTNLSSSNDGGHEMAQKLCKQGRLKDAINLVKGMEDDAPKATYIFLLKECIKRKMLTEGKRVHSLIVQSKCNSDIFLVNNLIDMYAKCGCLDTARELFDKMSERTVVSWNAMIAGYAQNGLGKEAIVLYEQMKQEGVEASRVTFLCVLKACANIGALEQGKQIHSLILEKGFHLDMIVKNTLVDMYAKCGCLDTARELFNKMSERTVVSWNSMIGGYAQNRFGTEAIALYEQMKQEGLEADRVTFVCVLKACANMGALEQGKQIHSLILEKGFHLDMILQSILVDMYAKCGCLDIARELFNNMNERNVVSWTAMIAGYAQNGFGTEAIALYEQMKQEGMEADRVTFVCVLKACTDIGALEEGKRIHSFIIEKGFHLDMIVQSTLVDMYAKCGCLDEARELFNKMSERNVVSWTAMIAGYAHNGLGKEAIALYEKMKQEGMEANRVTFLCVLKACADVGALEKGEEIHSLILKKGLYLDVIVQSTLVEMYAKCGYLDEARELFNKMSERTMVSWNAMIAGYAHNGMGTEAIVLYEQMKQEGMEADRVTFVCVLKACANIGALEQGKQIHSLILEEGFYMDMIVQSTLIDMYTKCGSLDTARELFNKMSERTVVSWTAMIAGYAQNGLGKEAIALYEQMKQEGMEANRVTFLCVLKACANIGALERGKQIHSLILEKGFHLDMIVQSTLVDMYAKCGCLDTARELFNKMSERTVVSWNAMIAGYAQSGLGKEAIALYEQMKQEGMEANRVTFVCVLKACANIGTLEQGKQIHSLILEKGFHLDKIIQNTLVNMYAKCGCLDEARELFNKMYERTVVSWNAMIAGYVRCGLGKDAIALYEQMKQEEIKADRVTFVCVLKACANIRVLEQGKQIHSLILEKGFHLDVIVQSTLVDMYAKCGCLDTARELFNNMSERNVVSWTAIIAGYAQNELGMEAIAMYEQMKQAGIEADRVTFVCVLKACASIGALEQGKQIHSLILEKGFHLDMIVQSTLVDMYAKCGCVGEARELFNRMNERNVVSWTAMIAGYAQNGLGKEAIALYEQMKQEGMEANKVTFLCVLKACANIGALEQGKQIHSLILEKGLYLDMIVQSTLVDMYAKCGCLDEAHELFIKMSERNVVSWNAMIAGYAQNGLGIEAIALYEQMKKEGIQPNELTFTCVLSACSHSGLLEEGFHVFDFLCGYSGAIPTLDHYACMVDLLGRAGLVVEAKEFIMKIQIQPDSMVWMSLLGAARNVGNAEIGQLAFNNIVKLDPQNAAAYVLLIDVFARGGQMDRVTEIRKEMKKCLKKMPGSSWIVVDNEVHAFVVGNKNLLKVSRFGLQLLDC